MDHNTDDIVKVASGSLIEINELTEVLHEAGIVARVVGDDLTGGLGTLIPGSVELWVLATDAQRAEQIVAAERENADHKAHSHEHPKFPHPVSDPKPDPKHGPHRNPEPRR